MKRTLITSALPYANGYIHLGHAAGAYLPADIYARFLRLCGEQVLYVCGSDEHGVAITISAEKENTTPKAIIDKYHSANAEAFKKFAMTFDIYSRTSTEIHHNTAIEFFADLLQKGYLIEKEEEQFYDEKAQMFLPDRYVEGTCPNCGYEHARGDQCDKCGAYYNQLELKNPRSVISGEPPVVRKTTHWYMRFGEFQNFLEEYIESKSSEWKDNVLQQSRSWLRQGLTDRAITRDLSWGVRLDKVPGIDKNKAKGKVLYVWFDAVLGYISITKEWAIEQAQNGRGSREDWKIWWQDNDTRYIAFIGKDNIVFHTLIFPAMLKARGGYILPDNVPANEFLNLEGEKFSKSRNWSIDLRDFQKDFPEPQYTDALRYTLAMNAPETRDSDFTWRDFQNRNNNELADIFGNFVNRTLQFIFKNFEQKIPTLSEQDKSLIGNWNNLIDTLEAYYSDNYQDTIEKASRKFSSLFTEAEFALISSVWKHSREAQRLFNIFRFRDAITETMNIARAANKFFNDAEPWKTIKSYRNATARTLFICAQLVYSLSIFLAPIIPNSAKRVQLMLGCDIQTGEPNYDKQNENYWLTATYPRLEEGTRIQQPSIIFNKIEDSVIAEQINKLGKPTVPESSINEQELIEYDDFARVQLRTAVIKQAEKLPKSKKLLKLIVEVGNKQKQIIAGIAEHYAPDYLVGKTIVVVDNLKPAKLMGETSEGMLLAASTEDGRLCFVAPEKPDIGSGAIVK
ncbi:MAG TPA: methionine--tRNA ligase [Candidatus Kapabacteria bacterium]|nr:methionine--tRNA ligase [Candidatus Kapabacteria bacterium]